MRTQSNILKSINKKINLIKLLFIIILIFQSSILYQITTSKTIQTDTPQKYDVLENLSVPPATIPELEGIELETIVKHESI